jgi:hypothetical protein
VNVSCDRPILQPTGRAADQLHPGARRKPLDDVTTVTVIVLVDQGESELISRS